MAKDLVPRETTTRRRTKEEIKEHRRRLMKKPSTKIRVREEEEEEEDDTDLTRAFKKALPALRLETEQENQIMAFLRGFNSRDEHLRREIDDVRKILKANVERARDFQKEIHEAIGAQLSEERQN